MGVYRKRSLLSIYPYKQTGLSRALFSTTERKYRLLAEVTFSRMYKSLYYMHNDLNQQPETPHKE